MERKRWSLIFIGLCLAFAFSVSPAEAQKDCDFDMDTYVKDTNKCRKLLDDPGEPLFIGIDCDDTNGDAPEDPDLCGDGGEEDTTGGKPKSIALIMTFDDWDMDNVQSDRINYPDDSPYVDEEGASVGASERSQPNPAAGIGLGLNATKKRHGRQLDLYITCVPIELDDVMYNCEQPFSDEMVEFVGLFPTCEENNFCSLGASVRPYKVDCPEEEPLPCPDIFTMPGDGTTTQLMSYRLSFGGGALFIEVASAIGGDGALDPGRCLSLLTGKQRDAFFENECLSDDNQCNVSVMASNDGDGMGGENDAWRVEANGVTALICLRNNNTNTVLGKATLWFGFNAIKK